MTTGFPAQRNLDGSYSVLTIWSCRDCSTREWLYTPLGDGTFAVTCNGCKKPIGIAGPSAAPVERLAPALRADRED